METRGVSVDAWIGGWIGRWTDRHVDEKMMDGEVGYLGV